MQKSRVEWNLLGNFVPGGQSLLFIGTFIKLGPINEQTASFNPSPNLIANLPTIPLLERYAYDNFPSTPLCGGLACIVIYIRKYAKKVQNKQFCIWKKLKIWLKKLTKLIPIKKPSMMNLAICFSTCIQVCLLRLTEISYHTWNLF